MTSLVIRSYFEVFSACKYSRNKCSSGFCCLKQSALNCRKQEMIFVGLAISSQSQSQSQTHNKSFHSTPAFALPKLQATDETENIHIIETDLPKTVHVRFNLHKECAFGQQFLIVGDDPTIGLWDPSHGVPLNWSDGHVWTLDLDMPIRKVIKYKFLLKGDVGTMFWQPGPDRILETLDTEKTINVIEDWDNPELQNLQLVSQPSNDISTNLGSLIVDENLNMQITDEEVDVEKELDDSNGFMNLVAEQSAILVPDNIVEGERDLSEREEKVRRNDDESNMLASEGEMRLVSDEVVPVLVPGLVVDNVVDGEKDLSKREEGMRRNDDETLNGGNFLREREMRLVSNEAIPVLVPGLIPVEQTEVDVALANEVERNNGEATSVASDEAEKLTVPELRDEDHESASSHPTETVEEMIDKKQPVHDQEQLGNNILEGDMQWGRQTLQKFLASLGFQMS